MTSRSAPVAEPTVTDFLSDILNVLEEISRTLNDLRDSVDNIPHE